MPAEWGNMPAIPQLEKMRQEDHKLKASLSNIYNVVCRLCLKQVWMLEIFRKSKYKESWKNCFDFLLSKQHKNLIFIVRKYNK
jgi:hypothetical protein